MAILKTLDDAAKNQATSAFPDGSVIVREASATITVADGEFQMLPVFEGERVLECELLVRDDPGTAATFEVGDEDDTDRWIVQTALNAGGTLRSAAVATAALAEGRTAYSAANQATTIGAQTGDDRSATLDVVISSVTAGASDVDITLRAWITR